MSKKKQKAAQRKISEENQQVLPSIFEKLNYLLVLLLLFVVPVVFVAFTYDPFDLVKNVIFRIAVFFMLFLFAFEILIRKKVSFLFHPASFFMLAFLIWALLATVDSYVPLTSFWGKYRRFEGLYTFISYFIFLVLSVHIFGRDRRRIEKAMFVSFIAASLISIYGILQYFGYDFMPWGSLPFEERRSFSTLGNPALLAGYLVAVFPLSLTYSIFTRKRFKFALSAITTLLTFTCLVTAFNRTSWLAAALSIISLMVIVIFLARKGRVEGWVYRNAAIFLGAMVLIFAALAVHSQMQRTPLTVVKRIEQMTEVGGSFAHRLEIWKAGLRMAYKEPLNGLGPDTFRATSRMFQGEKYGHIAADIVADNAHNYGIQLAAGTGFVGLLFFLAFVFAVFFEGIRSVFVLGDNSLKKSPKNEEADRAPSAIVLGVLISFLAYIFQMITSVSVIGSTIMWWFSFAAILSNGKSLKRLEIELPLAGKIAAVLLTAVAFLLTAVFNVRLLIADLHYRNVKSLSANPMALEILEREANSAMKFNPWQWEIPAETGRAFFMAYRLTGRVDYLEKALNYTLLAESIDRYEADIKATLVQIYLEMMRYDKTAFYEAETVAKKMSELMPHHYVSWLSLGEVYFLAGEYEKAINAFHTSLKNNPSSAESYYYLYLCYKEIGDDSRAAEFKNKAMELKPELFEMK